MEARNTNDIIFILDKSGSMYVMGNEPKHAMNNFINEQKSLNVEGTKFSLTTFNNNVYYDIDNVLLSEVPVYTNYIADGGTALYDAIGNTIYKKKETGEFENVICVILTDGMENSSLEYNSETVKNMISDMETNHGWKFIFLAANQDAFSTGANFGVSNCANFEYSGEGFAQMTQQVSCEITRFRSGESSDISIKSVSKDEEKIISL
jgi:hypothetical protein